MNSHSGTVEAQLPDTSPTRQRVRLVAAHQKCTRWRFGLVSTNEKLFFDYLSRSVFRCVATSIAILVLSCIASIDGLMTATEYEEFCAG